jgi:hypothetical protein
MDRLLNGSFHELEAEATVIPFMIKEEWFNKVFVLVDGMYPSYIGEEKKYALAERIQEKCGEGFWCAQEHLAIS